MAFLDRHIPGATSAGLHGYPSCRCKTNDSGRAGTPRIMENLPDARHPSQIPENARTLSNHGKTPATVFGLLSFVDPRNLLPVSRKRQNTRRNICNIMMPTYTGACHTCILGNRGSGNAMMRFGALLRGSSTRPNLVLPPHPSTGVQRISLDNLIYFPGFRQHPAVDTSVILRWKMSDRPINTDIRCLST